MDQSSGLLIMEIPTMNVQLSKIRRNGQFENTDKLVEVVPLSYTFSWNMGKIIVIAVHAQIPVNSQAPVTGKKIYP